jgi:hypothetical protein
MPPITPRIAIEPTATSASISSGQSVTINFLLLRVNDDSAVSLSISTLPAGITAALSPQSLPSSPASQKFSLTLRAAPDVVPAEATISVMAGSGITAPRASVNINAKASPKVTRDATWSNWGITDSPTSTGRLYTPALFQPTDPSGISFAITQAEHDNQTVRAVGSGFSFSEASFPQTSPLSQAQIDQDIQTGNLNDLYSHAGYTIDISGCNQSLQDRLASLLLPNVDGLLLYFTEAGITIHDLNVQLGRFQGALKTMGGSDGQTIAGAIATGTHGADFDRGPLADSVRAIYLIGAGGVHHWVEPSGAITDPARVQAAFPDIAAANVHYDDDLFRSVLVSVGAMGVVYAVILDVVPQYALAQLNLWTTWESVSGSAASGSIFNGTLPGSTFPAQEALDAMFPGSQPVQYRALQIVVNPIRNGDGTHNCYVTTRFEIPLSQIPASMKFPGGPASGSISDVNTDMITNAIKKQPEWDAGSAIAFEGAKIFGTISGATLLEQLQSLIDFCKSFGYYWAVRAAIDCIMQLVFPTTAQADVPNPQVNNGFEIMAGNVLGQNLAMQVVSAEAFFPYDGAVAFVQAMLGAFDAGLAQNVYPAGYLSLRACGPTVALLGMEQFGKLPFDPQNPQCAGAVEMSLKFNADDVAVLQQFEAIALAQEPQHGNLHWGQSNGLLTAAEVQSNYAGLEKWIKSQAQLGGKAFINEFMQRCGLAPSQPPPPPVAVPNVSGKTASAAIATIRAAGLGVSIQQQNDPLCEHVGEVMSQSPDPGTMVPQGTPVTIRVGHHTGPCP